MERTLDSNLNFAEQSSVQYGHLPVRLFSNFMLWQRRINTRRELARLDDRKCQSHKPRHRAGFAVYV